MLVLLVPPPVDDFRIRCIIVFPFDLVFLWVSQQRLLICLFRVKCPGTVIEEHLFRLARICDLVENKVIKLIMLTLLARACKTLECTHMRYDNVSSDQHQVVHSNPGPRFLPFHTLSATSSFNTSLTTDTNFRAHFSASF